MAETLDWLLYAPLGREKLALLVFCMMSSYVVATNLAWNITGRAAHGTAPQVGHSWFGQWLVRIFRQTLAQILRFLYYVGVPLVVVWRGGLIREVGIPTTYASTWDNTTILSLIGLGTAQDAGQLGKGLVLAGGALVILVVVGAWYVRQVWALCDPSFDPSSLQAPWWVAVREAVFAQLLWALYRGCVLVWTSNSAYVAFISLALIALPWTLNPQRRQDLYEVSRGHAVVQDWLFALFTAFIATTVRVLWPLILAHTLWFWVNGRVLAHFFRSPMGMAWAMEHREEPAAPDERAPLGDAFHIDHPPGLKE